MSGQKPESLHFDGLPLSKSNEVSANRRVISHGTKEWCKV